MPDFSMLPPIGPGSQQAQAPQSLLQMAQDAMGQDVAPSAPPGGWAPDWVRQQLAAWNRDAAAGQKSSDIGFGRGAGSLVPYLNPDNWGPPPSVQGPAEASGGGWFPNFSGMGPSDPNEKFWTMKDYNRSLNAKYGGDAGGGGDESPNTRNWRLLQGAPSSGPVGPGAEPGRFMYLGHPIGQFKLQYDTHRPISDPATAGSFLPYHGFGRGSSGWSTTGEVGFPGQLDPFATSWGAGGPGG